MVCEMYGSPIWQACTECYLNSSLIIYFAWVSQQQRVWGAHQYEMIVVCGIYINIQIRNWHTLFIRLYLVLLRHYHIIIVITDDYKEHFEYKRIFTIILSCSICQKMSIYNQFKFNNKLQSIQKYLNMNIDQDDLETFLIETELVNQKVKALAENRLSPQEFDHLQEARAEDKRKREQGKKRIERQKIEKKKLGRQGKGITKDFQNFCRHCHREYQMPTPICVRCNKNTMTLKERQDQLAVMVDEYKNKKKRREERKMKWDMWQKTKAMLWKKTSNNYDKWEYFVSDSQEQPEQEPIVPKNDPNFMALERDIEQRKAQRMKDTKKAKQLKDKGNNFMKEKNYEQAKNMYTLALEHIKDIKSIYTNRALAYIKLGKFNRAIKDCTNVIEYVELFEKVQANKDLIFKAYLRRSCAKKQLKQYKDALDDCNSALKLIPDDKSAQILKKQLEGFIVHSEKVQKLLRQDTKSQAAEPSHPKQPQGSEVKNQDIQENENGSKYKESQIIKQLAEAEINTNSKQQESTAKKLPDQKSVQKQKIAPSKHFSSEIQQIKARVEDLSQQNISALFRLIRQNQDMVSIFTAAKGVQKCLKSLVTAQECKKQGFLVSTCLRGDGVGEKEVWDFGVFKIHDRVSQLLSKSSQLSIGKYFVLQDIFQVLIPMSLHEKYRMLISDSQQTYAFLQRAFTQLVTRHKKQPDLLSSLLIYMGNLCSGSSKLRDTFISHQTLKTIVNLLHEKVISKKSANRSQLNLKKNIYSLYANLAINVQHRTSIVQILNEKEFVDEKEEPRWCQLVRELKYYNKSQQNFNEYILSLLSLFANIALGTSFCVDGLVETINSRYLCKPTNSDPQIINRSLLVLSRIKYEQISQFDPMIANFSKNLQALKQMKGTRNPMQQIVRLLNVIYCPIKGQPKFSTPLPKNLLTEIKGYISSVDCGQNLFCNSCNMFCVILDSASDYTETIYKQLKPNMKYLIEVAKDKVGNWRKNACTLLAKLSLNAECRLELQKNHGMEVLKSVAQFVKPQA